MAIHDDATQLLRVRRLLLEAETKLSRPKKRRRRARPQLQETSLGETGYEPFQAIDTLRSAPGSYDGPLERSEAEAQAAEVARGKKPLLAAYWAVIGPSPECEPGDLATAQRFYAAIVRAVDEGPWTHSERTALGALEKKWRRRAYGEDPRFLIAGTRPGRLLRGLERRIETLRRDDGHE
jgi:hypothetical protein